MSNFTHLHTHSHFSLLNALPKIPELLDRAEEHDMSALALTDDGNLYGAIEFYKQCQERGITPIIGVDFYVAVRTRLDKQAGIDNKWNRLVLLSKNETGYQNLIDLVTRSHLEGFYYKPRIDFELMDAHNEGLVCIIPSFSGGTSRELENDHRAGAEETLARYKKIFDAEDTYLEITHHPEIDGHQQLMKQIISLGHDSDTPLVAAHDVYYLDPDDQRARETLQSVQSSSTSRRKQGEEDFSFISPKQAKEKFSELPEAIENVEEITRKCDLDLTLGDWVFPDMGIPENTTYDQELRDLVYEGVEQKGIEKTDEVIERIEYELDVIKEKGYSPYFLIVSDLLRYAHENDILTTIRGSVSGSFITYLAGITNINPLEYNLQFERFLNPQRPSAPDIDMDFQDDRRDEVIDYAREKYGEEKVAQIGTFGTMAARGAVRDVARALGFPYSLGDTIAKLIPMGQQGFKVTIANALEEVDELKELYDTDEDAQEVIDMAQKIEGCARHISVHAAGVVIAPDELTKYTPLQEEDGNMITQYDMHSVEDAGLIKFDFLGLKNLSILADAIERVDRRHGEKIDIEEIPLDDEDTFALLSNGETMGIFQLNGERITQFLQQLQPTTIHDINAMVALYRPGPMEFIPDYIERKNNPEKVEYPHEDLEDILEQSFGLLIYQEDVMLTAIELAGYSWLEADKFRKAMGKKIPELMKKQEKKFKEGCIDNGIDEELAQDLWKRIKPFAAYAFNKAHSASYGRVAYQTAYMKANYTIEYMAAIMTADAGNVEKIADAINECERMGIEVLAPDINESFGTFTIVQQNGEDKIRFGLSSIKNFGEGIGKVIIDERGANGDFDSLANFLERVQDRNLNKGTLEALIKGGALDQFEERGKMLANLEGLIEYNRENRKQADNQGSLFANMDDDSTVPDLQLKDAQAASQKQKLRWERKLLGLYLSGHPLDEYQEILDNRKYNIKEMKNKMNPGMQTITVGLIEEISEIRTKNGNRMAFASVADFSDDIEVVAFPDMYSEYENILEEDTCIKVKGELNKQEEDEEISIVGKRFKQLDT